MKKTFIPSKSLLAFSIVIFIVFIFSIWVCSYIEFWTTTIELISDEFKSPSIFHIFLAVADILISFVVFPFIIILLLYGAFEHYFFAGRPISFYDDTIRTGLFKKKKYYKKDITGIGIAPAIYGSLFNNCGELFNINLFTDLGIYIAFGNFKRSDLSEYGIMNVWEDAEFRRILPHALDLTNKICAKSYNIDCSKIQHMDGLLWMSYTEDNLQFLQNWLGSKFDELTES